MSRLPKYNIPGHAHFVTTKTNGNRKIFNDKQCSRIVLKDIEFYRQKLSFDVIGYCLMPNHLHLIMWWDVELRPGLTISRIMHRIKGVSAKHLSDYFYQGRQGLNALPVSRGIQAPTTQKNGVPTRYGIKIWQSSFYDFNIYSEKKLLEKLAYIHDNPRRAGLVRIATDYPFSSARSHAFGERSVIHVSSSFI